ncbi:MAG TPA: hypothetical protein VI653_00755 [Steroidobacteraceae bacterium]
MISWLLPPERVNGYVLLSETLREEWHKHAGRNKVFMRWLRQMFGRKKVDRLHLGDISELTGKIVQHGATEEEREQMAKDVHLLAAALRGNLCILSMDDRARRCYRKAARSIDSIADICWVNPANETEHVISWLAAGAPAETHRQLGSSGSTG